MSNAIGLNFLRVLSYSSALVADTRALPDTSGIYYAVKDNRVLYIGKAINLRLRWAGSSHHQKTKLLRMGGVVLFYRLVGEHRLLLEEAKEIQLFNPLLNQQRPNPSLYDRGLVRIDSIARDAFWTFVLGMSIALPVTLFLVYDSKLPTPQPNSQPTSQPTPQPRSATRATG